MKKFPFTHAQFLRSSLTEESYPATLLPEIALVGRSNVGKSSLINHLLNNKKLARVSSTPGKTQTINFFTVDSSLMLVDLPGYGYAKVSHETKKQWSSYLDLYFQKRDPLNLVLLLLDIRRTPTEDDLALVNWLYHNDKKLLIVFTKTDKVKEHEKNVNTKANLAILQEIYKRPFSYVHYTVKDAQARHQLIDNINAQLQ